MTQTTLDARLMHTPPPGRRAFTALAALDEALRAMGSTLTIIKVIGSNGAPVAPRSVQTMIRQLRADVRTTITDNGALFIVRIPK